MHGPIRFSSENEKGPKYLLIRPRPFEKIKKTQLISKSTSNSFKSRQSFGKAFKKVKNSLPKCDMKKKIFVKHLGESYNLIPKSKHQRTSLKLADKLKDDVYNFYIRDDISYQLPG